MNNLWIVTKNILKRLFKKPGNFIVHLILPIITSLTIFLLLSGNGSSKINMAVLDRDQTKISAAILDSISNTGKFEIIYADEAQAEKLIADNSVSFAFFIPKDFENKIMSSELPEIEIISVGENEGTAWITTITNYQIQNIIDMAKASEYDKDLLYTMIDNANHGELSLISKNVEDLTDSKSAMSSSIGMYIMILLLSVANVSFLILEEKELGTFARIGISPVYAKIYTLSNILANLIIVVIQISVVLVVLKAFNMNFFMPFFTLFVILLSFSLAAISLGLMLASLAKKKSNAGALISLVTTPSCLIAGCFWPIELMPKYLQRIAYLTPQRWALDAIEVMQMNNNFLEALPNIIVVLGFAVLFFLIATYQFENQDKKFSL